MALKQQVLIVNPFTMTVGGTDIAAHSIAKLSSSVLVVATASTEATAFFVLCENGDGIADREVLCAGIGSRVLMRAHDNAITEGEQVVPAAAGRVDGIAALTGATQYVLGYALMASSAQDQLISVLYSPQVAPKAAA